MGQIIGFDPRKRRKRKERNAQIPHKSRAYRSSPRKFNWIPGLAIVAALGVYASEYVPLIPGCDIKGNISQSTGERIYHIPGQEYYWETRIAYLYGEQWFCSEEAARNAGWRKARTR
ncbi:sunset domain-containing protein [Rhizobium leguminosarum]|uniref:sunset domain-containing protein n=1 Tax=Rhizobium leguminosarum TaxID=384 RepID=UPI001E09FFF5|nr:hypothetical protein [Rhizobium leguminosarum]MBP2447277.1 hypothetical protein [Rhizobium leguminosarum]